MTIITIGSAIIDRLSFVSEDELRRIGVEKSSMSLMEIDIPEGKDCAGGSAANTAAILASMGCKTGFIGAIGEDSDGEFFANELAKLGVKFYAQRHKSLKTARSVVMVTPDGERTMCTSLGAAALLDHLQIHKEIFENASYLYGESYLLDSDGGRASLIHAMTLAEASGAKIALSLSDSHCVMRHRDLLHKLAYNNLQLIFGNLEEVKVLAGDKSIIEYMQDLVAANQGLVFVMTINREGAIAFQGKEIIYEKTEIVENPLDTTGAGDSFAAGFIASQILGAGLKESLNRGNLAAGKTVQIIGARLCSHNTISHL